MVLETGRKSMRKWMPPSIIFNLISAYPKMNEGNLDIQFVSLYRNEEGKIRYSTARQVSELEQNSIMEEFDALYLREQSIIYGDI